MKCSEMYYELLRQVEPRDNFWDMDSMMHYLCVFYVIKTMDNRFEIYPPISNEDVKYDYDTVAYVEQAYKDGYSVILNDGKIIGYEKIAPAV
jgi:hypothetical protein